VIDVGRPVENRVERSVRLVGAALEAVQSNEFDIMLMDLNYQRDTTSGQEGMELLARVQSVDGKLPVVNFVDNHDGTRTVDCGADGGMLTIPVAVVEHGAAEPCVRRPTPAANRCQNL
jgi:CheY-like chemotaxis protein